MDKKPNFEEIRSWHGGYWRSNHKDFHYLFNHHFPTTEFYGELASRLSSVGNYYPSSQKTLASLLSKWKDAEHFSGENLVVGNGSSEIIRLLMDHEVTRAVVPLPTFNEFVSRVPDEKIHKYLLDEENSFGLDPDQLIAEAQEHNSEYAIIINPNNPVGNLTSISDLRKILDTGIKVITDEAFMSFAGEDYSAEQLVEEYSNLGVLASCTKSIGIAGLRLAYFLSTNEDMKRSLREHIPIWNINSMAEQVIEMLPDYKDQHRASLEKSREDTAWFSKELERVSYLSPFPTYANAVFCQVDGNSEKLARKLYDDHNLMIKEGLNQKDFPQEMSRRYARLGVRNRKDNQELLDALHEISYEDIQ